VTAQLAAGGEPGTVETHAGPIAVLRCGDSGATPVLLVPGYTGSKEDFAPLFAPLAAAGFAGTALDLPGQFESPGGADAADYTPDALARVLQQVAASIGPRVHLLGHSFGGLVARAAVIAAPAGYASLVLMCSGPSAIGGGRRSLVEQLEPVLAAGGIAAVYAAGVAAARAEPGYVEPPPALAAFLEKRFVSSAPGMLRGMGAAIRVEPDRVAELAAVAPPTLVLHGAHDDAWPPFVQAEMAVRLGAEHVVIEGAAHSPAVENPADTAAALIRFWRSHARV
jgi:pimeloyl-ACP methyl ester carboxylesterase